MSKRPSIPSRPGRPNANDQALQSAILALRMQRPHEAERIADQILKANRGNTGAAQILGQALLMQNRAPEAVAVLQRAARRSEDAVTETLLAGALAATGRQEEAFEHLSQAKARRPPYAPAFLEHGSQLARMGQFDEAIAVLDGGLTIMPEAVDLQKELASCHLRRNDRSKAREILLRALALAPERPDLLIGLAQVMLLDGEYAAAADHFRRAVALRPDDAMARADLGRCLLEMGEREAGEANIRMAMRETPQMFGRAVMSLAVASRGRFFLRPSAAVKYLRGQKS
jgi:tetratricopeptide (TPR) repeat protein